MKKFPNHVKHTKETRICNTLNIHLKKMKGVEVEIIIIDEIYFEALKYYLIIIL